MRQHPRGGAPGRDRVGEHQGKLTIQAVVGRYRSGQKERHIYQVLCDCGRVEDVPAHRLSGGKALTACSVCRTPHCRVCGISLGRPSIARTCSPECRRALFAKLSAEWRSRQGVEGSAAKAAYNRRRLATDPDAAESARLSKRRYHAARARDPEWLEQERVRKLESQRDAERQQMMVDLETVKGLSDD